MLQRRGYGTSLGTSPFGELPVAMLAGPVEKIDEARELVFFQMPEGRIGGLEAGCVEFVEKGETGLGDAAEDLTAVRRATLARDELLGLEPVDEARDAGRGLDHPFGDVERRQAFPAGAAQDPEDVVLLDGDALRFDDGTDQPAQNVRRAHETDSNLLRLRRKGLGLLQLLNDVLRHGRYFSGH